MGRLGENEINKILRGPHLSIISTIRPDGTPHMTPVWHLVTGEQIIVSAESTSIKVRNVRHNPNVALCLALNETPQRWLQVNGTASVDNEGVAEMVYALSKHYLGVEEGSTYAKDILERLVFVLLTITPGTILGFDGKP